MKFCRQLKKENKKKNYNNQKNKHKKDDDGDHNTEVNTTTYEFFVCYDYDMVNLANVTSMLLGWVNPGLSRIDDRDFNIISTGFLLIEVGVHNSSGNGLWKVTLGSLIVARGKRESKLYMTHSKISKSIVNYVLSGVLISLEKKCSQCLAGSKNRLAFKSRYPFRIENILDLVHFDVCGPMKTKTLGGCSYFVTFTDDHSRKGCRVAVLLFGAFVHIPKMNDKVDVKGLKPLCVPRRTNFDEGVHPELQYLILLPFLPIRRWDSNSSVVIGLAASLDLEVEQMDVKTAFLHGDLDKEIYMEQPEGFQVKGKEDYVCRLQKSLYGLKQAPRQWYKKFESVIGKQGYRKTSSDHCVFFQKFGDDDFIILLLYVDDMLIVGKNIGRIA
ncbi:putative RNA-directed DNA polymerase [Tanacetum coccineum]